MKLRDKKTGEIQTCDLIVITEDLIDREIARLKKHTLLFRSVEQFFDEYELYTPAEPLIKDEKIRKAVREWAWANNIDEIDHWQGQLTGRKAGCNRGRAKIQFNRALGFNYGCGFNIAELCGEGEE